MASDRWRQQVSQIVREELRSVLAEELRALGALQGTGTAQVTGSVASQPLQVPGQPLASDGAQQATPGQAPQAQQAQQFQQTQQGVDSGLQPVSRPLIRRTPVKLGRPLAQAIDAARSAGGVPVAPAMPPQLQRQGQAQALTQGQTQGQAQRQVQALRPDQTMTQAPARSRRSQGHPQPQPAPAGSAPDGALGIEQGIEQLTQEMELNLRRLKQVLAETQSLAEKMETFLGALDQQPDSRRKG